MKYKFIGTEQDLIDNGFEVNYYYACRGEYNSHEELFIKLDDGDKRFLIQFNSLDIETRFLDIKDYIQDLIDKGLVETYE